MYDSGRTVIAAVERGAGRRRARAATQAAPVGEILRRLVVAGDCRNEGEG